MRANLEAEQVNWLVHQSLRNRLTPYREPAVVRVARTPGGRWLFLMLGVVVSLFLFATVFVWGMR